VCACVCLQGMLDGDRDGLVSEHKKRAERDVVQFVALKDCKTQEDLVSEVCP
jgi:hypothetical protein